MKSHRVKNTAVAERAAAPGVGRRVFLQAATGVVTSFGLSLALPARVRAAAPPPGARTRLGQIGCGRIARVHDLPGVLGSGLADVVAVCDLDGKRAADARPLVEKLYQEKGLGAAPALSVHRHYREILERSDIEAVVISTPDHWHAQLALAAVRAGKDVYLQKPFTMTHAEGVLVRDAVQKGGRILQVGSQQRSMEQFRRAAELVRAGRIGAVRRVEIGLPIDPTQADSAEMPVPANLDYDAWLGPTALMPYTETRVHPQGGYDRPGWLRNEAYCLGMITGWGSHHFDSLHWALDCELSGPSRVEGKGEFPKNKVWNVHGAYDVRLTYPKGVQVSVSDKHPNGLKFIGDEGWIWVTREGQTTSSDPKVSGEPLPPLAASKPSLLDPSGVKVELPHSTSHHTNWLEAVRSRKAPLAPAAVAHRSASACIVSWVAMKLGRPLTWDAQAERFVKDKEANAFLSRAERAPFGATRLVKA
ncbi:MAG TPA: Gfo/Idh/MocA family oxidoreductase [Polyangiaceae bacterium]|nr:Gfo/Idh/MocA family oxidoreductase [Polyangiaceae bacterium]